MLLTPSDEPSSQEAVKKPQAEVAKESKRKGKSARDAAKSVDAESNRDNSAPLIENQRSQEEVAIRLVDQAFVKAYEAGDAAGVAAHFTTDAEYVDETGSVLQGREAIAECLVEFFKDHPKCRLEKNVNSIRVLSPGVAVEDGHTVMCHENDGCPIECHYSTVYVKVDGKWLAASMRDRMPTDLQEHATQLRELDWLIGDWVEEGDDAVVNFSCNAADNGNFLLRSFAIHVAGQDAMTGTQRIGWDPQARKLRTWIFDSEGSFGEGFWHRRSDEDGSESWVLKITGVMADGQTASSTSIYTAVDEQTMTWQSVDHEISGVHQPDSDIVTIVRSAPVPAESVAGDSR